MTKKQSKVMRTFQIRMITQLAQGTFSSIDLKNEFFVKWLVGYMADNQIPFQLIPLGAGVTRIVLAGCLCPHCQGKGFFSDPSVMTKRPALLDDLQEEDMEEASPAHPATCGGNCACEDGCASGGTCCQTRRRAA
jgi:hypothetical protein